MKAYLAVIRGRLSALLQYRAAVAAGMMTQVFWGIVNVMILQAFYDQSTVPQPISLEQAITFVWLGQALLQLIPWSIDKELEAQVRSGNVAYELIRPISLYWLYYARSVAMRVIPTMLRCFLIFFVASFFGLSAPISINAGIAFSLSLCLSALLSAAMTSLVIITLFWTISGEGIQRLMPHVTVLLTGMVVPLPLFPSWMQPFLDVQPFRGILDIPIRLYTGVIPVHEAFYWMTFQACWALAFVCLGRFLMTQAMKRLVIQGG